MKLYFFASLCFISRLTSMTGKHDEELIVSYANKQKILRENLTKVNAVPKTKVTRTKPQVQGGETDELSRILLTYFLQQ
jgi:hypothetical protein